MTTFEQRLDEAEQRFQQGRAGLFRSDGTPLYSEAEHADREASVWSTLRRDFDTIGGEAEGLITSARTEIDTIESADPTAAFTRDQLDRITRRAALVEEDALHLPVETLVTRLRTTVGAGDRPEMYLALRAGRRRLAALTTEREQQRGDSRYPDAIGASPELTAVVQALESKFIDTHRREAAAARIAAAESALMDLGARSYFLREYTPRTRPTQPAAGAR